VVRKRFEKGRRRLRAVLAFPELAKILAARVHAKHELPRAAVRQVRSAHVELEDGPHPQHAPVDQVFVGAHVEHVRQKVYDAIRVSACHGTKG
jgi:hypothetical protein